MNGPNYGPMLPPPSPVPIFPPGPGFMEAPGSNGHLIMYPVVDTRGYSIPQSPGIPQYPPPPPMLRTIPGPIGVHSPTIPYTPPPLPPKMLRR